MLTEYRRQGEGIVAAPADLGRYGPDVVWLDALDPEDGELERLSRLMGFDLPNRHDMTEIELSSRLYRVGEAYVMIANLLPRSDTDVLPPRPAAFILRENLLVTVRFCDFFSFDRLSQKLLVDRESPGPQSIFCTLLDESMSDRADDLEFSMRHMETLTAQLFRSSAVNRQNDTLDDQDLDEALIYIGGMGERVSNIRESIASMQRVLNYAQTYIPQEWIREEMPIIRALRSDLTALSDEAAFFMNKLAFNLDATLGMINIEETKIVRVLSVVTLVLSPPVLIAGVYGMNFVRMPELEWYYGYPFALLLMLVTALVPLWFLKRKKWL